tara:strand:- start:91 stop:297 length:207 start_codon:yes stop_codon:yes gene_type:complete
MNNTQIKQVSSHLKEKKKITSWEAIMEYKCTRLSAVIYTLRKDGWEIRSDHKFNKTTKKNFTEYVLED